MIFYHIPRGKIPVTVDDRDLGPRLLLKTMFHGDGNPFCVYRMYVGSSRSADLASTGMVFNPACCQLNRENDVRLTFMGYQEIDFS